MFSSYLSEETEETISQRNQQKHSNPYKPIQTLSMSIITEGNMDNILTCVSFINPGSWTFAVEHRNR